LCLSSGLQGLMQSMDHKAFCNKEWALELHADLNAPIMNRRSNCKQIASAGHKSKLQAQLKLMQSPQHFRFYLLHHHHTEKEWNPPHTKTHKIQCHFPIRLHYNSTCWNIATPRNINHTCTCIWSSMPLPNVESGSTRFYLVKHYHKKIVMKPITQTHLQNSIQFPNVESSYTTILPSKTWPHQESDDTHHTKTYKNQYFFPTLNPAPL
jgi:hypothetical protein